MAVNKYEQYKTGKQADDNGSLVNLIGLDAYYLAAPVFNKQKDQYGYCV